VSEPRIVREAGSRPPLCGIAGPGVGPLDAGRRWPAIRNGR